MNKPSILKKVTAGLLALVAGVMISAGVANAIPYTGDTTVASPVPAFNVFTGNMAAPAPLSGEGDFFQGRVPANGDPNEGSTPFTDPVNASCTDGQLIQLHVYVHNGASADKNDNGNGPSVAHNTRLKVALPTDQASTFKPDATISADNAATVNDTATINCNGKTVKLEYIAGSASQYSDGNGELPLSDAIVGGGVQLQSEKVPGDVWGCWNERVYVVLSVKVVEVKQPVTPAYSCDVFTIVADVNRSVKVSTFATTATNGATFKNAVINWGDNSANTTADNIIGQTHQYDKNKDATYTISATAHFMVGDTEVTAGGPKCVQVVSFNSTKPPVVTPPTTTVTTTTPPKTLVNTGAGSTLGLFAAATLAGMVIYRRMLNRRLSNQ